MHDMCPNTCLAFVGPYSALDACWMCHMSRWNEAKLQGISGRVKVPTQQFTTIPVDPQLQAHNRAHQSACNMHYLWKKMQEIFQNIIDTQSSDIPIVDDIAMGWDYLSAVLAGDIQEHDIILMVSLDGAQLYKSKKSDSWMYTWVICNLSPNQCYRKLNVHPSGFIPGPRKPKNPDSFLFPGFHHLTTIQRKGLAMWDPLTDSHYSLHVYLLFTTTDGPGLVY